MSHLVNPRHCMLQQNPAGLQTSSKSRGPRAFPAQFPAPLVPARGPGGRAAPSGPCGIARGPRWLSLPVIMSSSACSSADGPAQVGHWRVHHDHDCNKPGLHPGPGPIWRPATGSLPRTEPPAPTAEGRGGSHGYGGPGPARPGSQAPRPARGSESRVMLRIILESASLASCQ